MHHHLDAAPADGASGSSDPRVDDLLDRVRAGGGRVTDARKRVLEVLLAAGTEHLSADEVAVRVHHTAPDVHLSTVYRTLESLEEMNILSQARLGDGPASYHLASDRHHHAVCSACGSVLDLPGGIFVPMTRELEKDYGFVADPQHITVTGTCAACAADSQA